MVVTHIIETPATRIPPMDLPEEPVRTAIIIPTVFFAIGCSGSPDAARDADKPPSYWVQALQSPDAQVRKRRPTRSGKPLPPIQQRCRLS